MTDKMCKLLINISPMTSMCNLYRRKGRLKPTLAVVQGRNHFTTINGKR